MKAFVIAETADAQKELCAGARTLADEVLLVSIGSAPRTGVADKAYAVELPQGELVENAYDAVAALYDEVAPSGPWPSTPAAAPPSTASRPRAPTSWKSARSSPRKNPSSYAARMKFRTRAPT